MEPITARIGFEDHTWDEWGFFSHQPTRRPFEIVNRFKFLSLSGASRWHLCHGSTGPTHIDNYVNDQSADMTWPHGRHGHTHRQCTAAISATAAHLTTLILILQPASVFSFIHNDSSTVSLMNIPATLTNCAEESRPPHSPTIGIVFARRLQSLINVIVIVIISIICSSSSSMQNYRNGCHC